MSVALIRGDTARSSDGLRWPWFSVTKLAISCAALRLHQRGALNIDTSLPGADYSLRHLLCHTAGLPCYGPLPDYHAAVAAGEAPWSVAEVLHRTGAEMPRTAPGDGWAYSNVGYLVALMRIEQLTGLSPKALLRSEVIEPLDLQDTVVADGVVPQPHISGSESYDYGWVYHHCLFGPALAAARMVHAAMTGPYLDDAGPITDRRPLGGAIPGRPWSSIGYGMGCMMGEVPAVGRAWGHSGAGLTTCAVYHFPDRGCTAAAFSTSRSEAVPERAVARMAA